MRKKENSLSRVTIRLNANQMQVLGELTEALGVSYSLLIRTIVLSFLTQNEPILEDIVTRYKNTGVPQTQIEDICQQ